MFEFDRKVPVFYVKAPVFVGKVRVFGWKAPVFDGEVPVFGWKAPVFDRAVPSHEERQVMGRASIRMLAAA